MNTAYEPKEKIISVKFLFYKHFIHYYLTIISWMPNRNVFFLVLFLNATCNLINRNLSYLLCDIKRHDWYCGVCTIVNAFIIQTFSSLLRNLICHIYNTLIGVKLIFCLGAINKPCGQFFGIFDPHLPVWTILLNQAYVVTWTFS